MSPPRVDCDRQHAILAVRDIGAAVAFDTDRLGFGHGIDYDCHASNRLVER
jgi:hypothetical protein